MPNSKVPWILVWGVSLPPFRGKIIWLSASLGALRGDLVRGKFRGECSDCLGTRCAVSLLHPAPQTLSSSMEENESLGVFRVSQAL